MADEVNELLKELHDGTVTLADVASRFRERKWPRRARAQPANYMELAAAELVDPEPYVAGSFDAVTAAYPRGDLTSEEYGVLAEAMAASKRAEDAAE